MPFNAAAHPDPAPWARPQLCLFTISWSKDYRSVTSQCPVWEAAMAFCWIAWICWMASLAIVSLQLYKSRQAGGGQSAQLL
jgi:hypothetical protein